MLKRSVFEPKPNTISLVFVVFTLTAIYADSFDNISSYQVYFTPRDNCTAEITRAVQRAQKSIYVQAYFLTSEPILSALVTAKARQVNINVILDKNHPSNQKGIKQLLEVQIPVWVDKASGIAHNKIMIIDEKEVITGSFNFTYSANHHNRENILLIKDKGLAQHYLKNWHYCKAKAIQEKPLRSKKSKTMINNRIQDKIIRLLSLIILGITTMLGIELQ